jgi:hypothetical protein
MLFFILSESVRPFEERSKMSLTRLVEICPIIFVLQESIVSPEKSLDMIGIEKFFLELIERRPV